MAMLREMKRKVRGAVAPALFLLVAAYFAWGATQGDLGLKAFARRQHDLANAQAVLAHTQAEMASWEQQVRGLRSNQLDTDALDERVRAMLNRAAPADVIVPYSQKDRLF
jgi:cell division protein FtsB